MSLTILNLLTNTMGAIMMSYFLITVLDKTYINKKVSIVVLSGLIIFSTFMNQIFGIASMISLIVIMLVSTNIYAYLLETKFMKILVYNFIGTTVMLMLVLFSTSIIPLITNVEPYALGEMNYNRITVIIISNGLFYFIINLSMGKMKIPRNIKKSDMNRIALIGIFNIIIVFMTFALYNNLQMSNNEERIYLILMGIGAGVFNLLIYRITQRIIEQSKKEIMWNMREEELLKEDFYIKNMNDILQTIRSQKHDLNNFLSTLYGLIYLEKFEESKKYITEINHRINNLDNIIETNHPVITALISMKRNKALEDDIEMIIDIDFPDKLPFDYVDLSIIIGNLLDNAIEACHIIGEDIKRRIQLWIKVEDRYLIIKIINTKDKDIKVDIDNIIKRFTTKENSEDHGYGLGNIEYVVKYYNGTMYLEDVADEFKINISLPMENSDKYEYTCFFNRFIIEYTIKDSCVLLCL